MQSDRSLLPPESEPISGNERMWPLDVSLISLSGLILMMLWQFVSLDHPNWRFNAWTYLIGIPLLTIGTSWMLRRVATQYIRKSLQLGILFSAFVHLLLIVLAVQLIIFPSYFPEAFAGVKPDRSPIRKTIPEYLFQTPDDRELTTPDWSKPTDAAATSRVIPMELRQLPPVTRSAPRLEIPEPSQPQPEQPPESLIRRDVRESSKPQPADSPSKLARRRMDADKSLPSSQPAPEAPELLQQPMQAAKAESAERRPVARRQASADSATVSAIAAAPDLPEMEVTEPVPTRVAAISNSMPLLGESGMTRRRSQRRPPNRAAPSLTAPAPPVVSIARIDKASPRMSSKIDTLDRKPSEAPGASISLSAPPSPAMEVTTSADSSTGDLPQRQRDVARSGLPDLSGDSMPRRSPNRRRGRGDAGLAPVGIPDSGDLDAMLGQLQGDGRGTDEEAMPAIDDVRRTQPARRSMARDRSALPRLAADPMLAVRAPDGLPGLGDQSARRAGVISSTDAMDMASMDLPRESRRVRRNVGGPIVPAGMAVAAVESFSRRVQRTNGGAAPAPAGMVGPATEEAIELGLAYLSSIQNDDGSWSLQGHGEDVLLQSDTAATGLCLLAFQGAGYTHRQHQYAATVARALEFLVNHQRTNGDLYRRENPISDQNVAFYSHGIAALALCEAYGMTQDSQLQDPAQACLNFIEATQHVRRGGWRYTAQVSADTSVTGWMMMALKSGDLSGLRVSRDTYAGINRWLELAKVSPTRRDLYRYNPFAPNTPAQGHGRRATPTMTAVGILMRMYSGWSRDNPDMQSAADYLLQYPPRIGDRQTPLRDTYYWYYATQVMFHMGGDYWDAWNRRLNPVLLDSQIKGGSEAGSWDPANPVPDRWSPHGGRLYVTTMNLLNLEVYYRHLPIYEETGGPRP
ncbi:MAG: hypothetical protein AAGC97_03820 [Planctomycetota bacterium]